MERIVFLERNTFKVEFPRPQFEHEWTDYAETAPHQVVERLQHATIAICNKLPLRAPDLSRLLQLKLIAVAATGVDNIDLDYCRQHGIAVCNAQHYAGNSLPEHVLLLMLALRRNLRAYLEDVRAGAWQQAHQFCLLDHPIHDLRGTLRNYRLRVFGEGGGKPGERCGHEAINRGTKGCPAIRPGRTAFNQVLVASDVITLHCPLTAETRNLIDWPELQMMKRGSVLLNTARGGLVNEAAVLRALREGPIAGAAFDVLSAEPPRAGNPLLAEERPNLIVTPHVAWASREAMQTLADQLVASLEDFCSGETAHRIV